VTENEISEDLNAGGYEVSPQTIRAAWAFVAFVDYPKHGYKDWRSYFSRVLWRLKINVDQQTLDSIVKLFEANLIVCILMRQKQYQRRRSAASTRL